MKTITTIFTALYIFGCLWLIVSGVIAFFTKVCTFWIGDKVFRWTGRKALAGGALLIVLGVIMFANVTYPLFNPKGSGIATSASQ